MLIMLCPATDSCSHVGSKLGVDAHIMREVGHCYGIVLTVSFCYLSTMSLVRLTPQCMSSRSIIVMNILNSSLWKRFKYLAEDGKKL